MKKSRCVAILAAISLLYASAAIPQARDMKVSNPGDISEPYTDTWLVLIGIDDYKHVRKLNYSVSDAESLKTLMMARYNIKPERIIKLYNEHATKRRISYVIGDQLADRSKVLPSDRVIIFFAGHGEEATPVRGNEMGYLIPVDGDPRAIASSCVSMREIQEAAKRIPARHVLFLVDACYGGISGLPQRSLKTTDAYEILEKAGRDQAVQIITAGDANQPSLESSKYGHSLFTNTMLAALSGEADADGDGLITSRDVFEYVGPEVARLSEERQTPQMFTLYGTAQVVFVSPYVLKKSGHKEPGPAARPQAPKEQPTELAMLSIESTPKGASVTIDGEELGSTPRRDIELEPGEHKVVVAKKGYKKQRRSVTLGAGDRQALSFGLKERFGGIPAAYIWIGGGAAAAAAAAGLLLASPADSDEDDGGGGDTGTVIIGGDLP